MRSFERHKLVKSRPKHTIKITIASIPIFTGFCFPRSSLTIESFQRKIFNTFGLRRIEKCIRLLCKSNANFVLSRFSRDFVRIVHRNWRDLKPFGTNIHPEMDSKDGATLIKDDFQKAYLRIFWVF